ncbi:B12-binding domain-containing radical SAM protein [Panacibacter sp. DH6]|uniref:B12-binding domain-containing radical SAM protein n=1 Tax=Panacibacter microcysteis TaxID=2793269 RepID=A0A931E980_9BACT|nr:radical SAM protein [Panacibacter microcysteis]MBG9377479.1 B12-binding domain-containing radical SAM protein [Panacibacter microcysteis]
MSAILFSHSYFLRFDPKQWKTAQPYPPLGTLYAAAVMQQEGHHVTLFDSMFAHDASEVVPYIEQQKPAYFVIYDDGFNYLTKMCLTNMREAAFDMIAFARQKGCTVIVSGSDSTDHFEKYLDKGADFILIGEAEITLKELINALEAQEKNFASIQGLAFRQHGTTIKTLKRNVIKELDQLPFPAWDIIDIAPYKKMWLDNAGYFSLNMGTTRGCPFKCNWCAKPIYGNRYNSRSPENVVQELTLLKEKFGYDHIWFCDDIFGLKPGWVNSFATLLQQAGLQLRFKIQARADLLLQENYIQDLARAGCDMIWMGAESGSQKILDAMDKGTSVEQIYEATRLIKKYGMKPCFFIQFGYPGETKEDIAATIKMINTLLPYDMGISVSYPLPGTKFFEQVQSQLKEKANWTDSDELALMFKNTYHPSFYKSLHRYVHASFRKAAGLHACKAIFSNASTLKELRKVIRLPYYFYDEFIQRKKLKAFEF